MHRIAIVWKSSMLQNISGTWVRAFSSSEALCPHGREGLGGAYLEFNDRGLRLGTSVLYIRTSFVMNDSGKIKRIQPDRQPNIVASPPTLKSRLYQNRHSLIARVHLCFDVRSHRYDEGDTSTALSAVPGLNIRGRSFQRNRTVRVCRCIWARPRYPGFPTNLWVDIGKSDMLRPGRRGCNCVTKHRSTQRPSSMVPAR